MSGRDEPNPWGGTRPAATEASVTGFGATAKVGNTTNELGANHER